MNKGYITISVPNNTTKEEIEEIRKQFKENKYNQEYRLNILISGTEDTKDVLKEVLISEANK